MSDDETAQLAMSYTGVIITLTDADCIALLDCLRSSAEALEWYAGDQAYEVVQARTLLERLVP